MNNLCVCSSAARLRSCCDLLTINKTLIYAKSRVHVRTMDIAQWFEGCQGLNHIPLSLTKIREAIAIVMDVFFQQLDILQLTSSSFPIEEA
jgi:hypothetical protein